MKTIIRAFLTTLAHMRIPKRKLIEWWVKADGPSKCVAAMEAHREKYGRYPQFLRGNKKPSDRRHEELPDLNLPRWVDVDVDEWDGPGGKGYSVNFWLVDKKKNKERVLKVERRQNKPSSPLMWTEVQR